MANDIVPKKKVCFITTISLTMKTFVVETAKYLHEKCGYDVTLICSPDDDFAMSLPEYLHYIPVHMNRGIDFFALRSIFEFIRIFRREQFDMVQYSTPNASCYASIAARIAQIPVRLYAQWGIRYTGMSGFSRKIFRIIEKMVCRNSTVIRAQSALNMQFSLDEGLCPKEKISVVGYGGTIGVDLNNYDIKHKKTWRKEIRQKYGINEDDFLFGFSGRITVDKGCRELLAAMRQLVSEGVSAKLLIVGPMDENCGIDKTLIEWAKQSPQVILTDMVDNSQMRKYYAAMDVLTHPTYREGFGMVLQEAGALGIPAITTRVPGASEVFEEGISSILVNVRNIEELKNSMYRLVTNRLWVTQLGDCAYVRTKARYARPIMLENQRCDYLNILGE